jgi:hypothetical protein
MEVIEVQDGFTLEKPVVEKEPGVPAAIRRGEQQQEQIDAMNQQEGRRMFSSVSQSMPAPRRVEFTHEVAEDDRAEHQRLVITLSRYGQSKRFAEYLKSMPFNLNVGHLRKLPVEQLRDIRDRVRITAQNRSVNNLLEDSLFGAIQFAEISCTNTPALNKRVRLGGLTQALRGDETFLDCIEAISLDYGMLAHAGPELRIVYALVSAASKVHGIITFVEKRKILLERERASMDAAPATKAEDPFSGDEEDEIAEGLESGEE